MKTPKPIIVIACGAITLVVLAVYGLFHGYFDHGQYDIKQVQWFSSKRVAIIAERSDQEALNGYIYFVLIGDHVYSPSVVRHAYYSNAVVFAAASSCLTLRWESSSRLVIKCSGPTLDRDYIDVQQGQSGSIAISYENIPVKDHEGLR